MEIDVLSTFSLLDEHKQKILTAIAESKKQSLRFESAMNITVNFLAECKYNKFRNMVFFYDNAESKKFINLQNIGNLMVCYDDQCRNFFNTERIKCDICDIGLGKITQVFSGVDLAAEKCESHKTNKENPNKPKELFHKAAEQINDAIAHISSQKSIDNKCLSLDIAILILSDPFYIRKAAGQDDVSVIDASDEILFFNPNRDSLGTQRSFFICKIDKLSTLLDIINDAVFGRIRERFSCFLDRYLEMLTPNKIS